MKVNKLIWVRSNIQQWQLQCGERTSTATVTVTIHGQVNTAAKTKQGDQQQEQVIKFTEH